MGAELEVVTTTVEIKDAAISQAGFGTPLIAGYHTNWAERVRTFSDPDEMLAAPFNMPVTHPIYLAAKAIMSQRPNPGQFKVGKRLGTITETYRLTPSAPTIGEVYSGKIDGETFTVTADGTPLLSEICAELATAIDALAALVDATDNTGTSVSVASTAAGAVHRYEELTPNLAIKNETANPGTTIQADLAAIRAYDSDWYGLCLDSNSETEILAAAAWAEAQRILLIVTTQDSEAKNGAVTTDVASDLETAGYHRTAIVYHTKPGLQFAGAAWLGRMLPKAPGSATWANKSLAGVDKVALSDTERGALKAKTANYYVDIKGIGFTLDGRASSGRYLDITHGLDWFEVRVQERVIALLANNDKIPYTDKGAELVRTQVYAQILAGIDVGLIDGDSPFAATVPMVATINPNDKANRLLPDVKFDFVLAGAVHKVQIKGIARITPA
jgi:hypothetical protein